MSETAPPHDPAHNGRLMKLATMLAMGVALTLIGVKLAAWMATGSVALLSTLIDSTLDAFASLINILAVRHALAPADAEHRFGHGKAEPLAGLAQSAFITGSGLFLIGEAGQRLMDPPPVTNGGVGIAVMVFSIVLTLALVTFQRKVINQTESVAIQADALHYASDLMMNVGVAVSLGLSSWLGWRFVDPIFAIGIGLYILWGAVGVAWTSYNLLMDREFPQEDRDRIKDICCAHDDVRSVHDLRTRSSGQDQFIQLHLELDGDMPLRRAHDISDAVEAQIRAAFPKADVIIHQDPAGLPEPRPVFD
ncbi:MAG TPA: cation diffusion facilitator family transporter [Candidatus Sulfotelmatobacter sp.]|jgi:ferrous-iron efflux pump FieF|nr:cation diffusion facilitator family transporter [Candidatus Sulfotelmatobacter sp.]